MDFKQRQVLDRFGRAIGTGDLVMIPGSETLWEVTDVRPITNVDPRAEVPPNAMQLSMIARWSAGMLGGQRQPQLIRVVEAEEREKQALMNVPVGGAQ